MESQQKNAQVRGRALFLKGLEREAEQCNPEAESGILTERHAGNGSQAVKNVAANGSQTERLTSPNGNNLISFSLQNHRQLDSSEDANGLAQTLQEKIANNIRMAKQSMEDKENATSAGLAE